MQDEEKLLWEGEKVLMGENVKFKVMPGSSIKLVCLFELLLRERERERFFVEQDTNASFVFRGKNWGAPLWLDY